MLFQVKTLTGKRFNLNTVDYINVLNIKEYLQQNEGFDPTQIRLIFNGRLLNDLDLIQNLITIPNTSVHMVLALRGG